MSLRRDVYKLLMVDLCMLLSIYVCFFEKFDFGVRYGSMGTLCITILGPAFVLFKYQVGLRYWLWCQNVLFFIVGYLLVFVTHKSFLLRRTIRKDRIWFPLVICAWVVQFLTVLYADYFGSYFSS